MADLVARCEKLSIQVNGQAHNAELFKKEMAALKAEDIILKIAGLEEQLAVLYPAGRKSKDTPNVHQQVSMGDGPINADLYRMK
jgi:hypothetical protein